MVALTKQHSFFSWSAQGAVNPIPVTRAEGVYFWDADGKRYLDFNSQVVNVNLGHGNREVIEAIPTGCESSLERDILPRLCRNGAYGLLQDAPFIDIGTPEALQAADAFMKSFTASYLSD